MELETEALKYTVLSYGDDGPEVVKVGKKAAGRLLEGREWNDYPR